MDRITPTSFGKTGGRRVKLLGSLRAVLEVLPQDGLLVVANAEEAREAAAIWREFYSTPLRHFSVSDCYTELYTIRPDLPIGVAPNAYRGAFSREAWDRIQRVLETRFKRVYWG